MSERVAAEKPKLVAIVGPTGSGKSALGWHLAKESGGEIISADSVQVYRGLDIGSAKPTAEERRLVIHHLVDILDPDEEYSAAHFRDQASTIIHNLQKKKIPIFVVGGTGLYLKTLTRGIFPGPGANAEFRRCLFRRMEDEGIEKLHQELSLVDREAAFRIHPRDTSRIIRALEVYSLTGRPISDFQKKHGFRERDFDVLKIGLLFPRGELYRRINERVRRMVEGGWIEEVENLLGQGYRPDLKCLQSLGYRQIISLLQGAKKIEETILSIQRDTRRYAKRQLSWLKADPEVKWFDGELVALGPIREIVIQFLARKTDDYSCFF